MLYCVTVFVVVKTKDKKKKNDLKNGHQMSTRKSQFFFLSLKCLVKPHRIGSVSSSEGCCSPFPTATATICNQLPALWSWGIAALLFSVDFFFPPKKLESRDIIYHTVIMKPYL